jgi:Glycoside hydrolase 123, N-terminal domain
MTRRLFPPLIALPLSLLAAGGSTAANRNREIGYSIPRLPWGSGPGNHRAVIEVPTSSSVVRVAIPWRRREKDPAKKRMIVVDSSSGRTVENVLRPAIGQESGEFLSGPAPSAGIPNRGAIRACDGLIRGRGWRRA